MLIEKEKITVLPSDKIPEIRTAILAMSGAQRNAIRELDWQRGVMINGLASCFPNLVRLKSKARRIPGSCWAGHSNLTEVALTDVKEIGAYAFRMCPRLQVVTISSGRLSRLDSGAFSRCPELREINFPDGSGQYVSRDGCLFSDTGHLLWFPFSSITAGTLSFPEGTTGVDAECLFGLPPLLALNIPASYTERYDPSKLYHLSHFERFIVHPDNPSYCSLNGLFYEKNPLRLLGVPPAYPQGHVLIPHCVRVAHGAFGPNANIDNVVFAKAVTLEEGAFISPYVKNIRFCDNVKLDAPFSAFGGIIQSIEFDGDIIPRSAKAGLTLFSRPPGVGLILCSEEIAKKIEHDACVKSYPAPKIIRL